MPASERSRELKRRRKRKEQLGKLKAKYDKKKVTAEAVAQKVRKITPGADQILENWGIKS